MAYKEPKSYEFFYQGTYSQLDPNYGPLFLGYRVPFSALRLHTNPQTANIIAEASDRLSSGVKGVMVNVLEPRTFESVPKQLFEEVRRLHKLVGAEPSMHAPIIDPAGFGPRGEWSEASRQEAEEHLKGTIDRAHLLDPNGNILVTIHASTIPSIEWWKKAPEKEGEGKAAIYAINTETSQITVVPCEEKYYPAATGVEKKMLTPEKALEAVNETYWHNRLAEIHSEKIHADKLLAETFPIAAPIWSEEIAIRKKIEERAKARGYYTEEDIEELNREISRIRAMATPEQQAALNKLTTVDSIYDDIRMRLNSLFNQAYTYYNEQLKMADEKTKKEYEKAIEALKEIGKEIYRAEQSKDLVIMHNAFSEVLPKLQQIPSPRIYQPIEEFALPRAAKTIANVAFHAFKKYGEKAPIIALENVYPNMAFSRADSLKKLIEESKKEFIKAAQKEGYSYDKAKSIADKLIGATWDVGHINLLKKHGYAGKELKEEITKETKKIAPFVKFVHLTDNFGFEDTHLAPGMGEVPFKEVLKELEKAGKLKHAIEAGGLLTMGAPGGKLIFPSTLEALGPPLYAYEPRAPFWNQIAYLQAAYSLGYGPIGTSLDIYSFTGFAALPQELGGAIPGRGQRFAGVPME
ncbi:MAG: hypothetical protein QXS77_02525 [Candidatus Pacearchaeota archaeon]